MLRTDLRKNARTRLAEASVLLRSNHYDGAIYICGYAIEFGLKARICQTLKWSDYPSSDQYRTFKTHDLQVLLRLSGIEDRMLTTQYYPHWLIVKVWSPENRYRAPGSATQSDAQNMINSTQVLLRTIIP